jgi:hypothetical protein
MSNKMSGTFSVTKIKSIQQEQELTEPLLLDSGKLLEEIKL